MEIEKEFELYRKLEVMAFRYFKMAEFLEICLKTNLKLKDPLSLVLNPKGYRKLAYLDDKNYFKKGTIHVPYNPFYNNSEDRAIWRAIFPEDFTWVETKDDIKKAYAEVWKRIHEIKWWLGVTKDTLFCGINVESRLTTLLENFLKTGIQEFRYDFEFTIFYDVDKYTIRRFLRIMKNRSRKGRIVQLME